MSPQQYIQKYPIITAQITKDELLVLLQQLSLVLAQNVAGDVVELGCYEGSSALFLSRMLQDTAPHKRLWLYDSFEGLPPKTAADASAVGMQFKQGQLHATKNKLIFNFKKARLPTPYIKKAWFNALKPTDLPAQICFAFLDGDFYESIQKSLALVWPHMSVGGVIVIDDYQNEALPGAAKAVNEFAAAHNVQLVAQHSLAIVPV